MKFPYHLIDAKAREEFEKKYAGKDDVPIFSDPRIVPTFHGVGAGIFATDPKTGEVNPTGELFAKWLDADPNRRWAMMMNYHPGQPIGEKGQQLFEKYRDRYLGSIAKSLREEADRRAGVVRAVVSSAAPLSDVYVQKLTQALEARYQKKVVVQREVDPKLLAGVVTRIGDTIIDGSLRARLDELRTSLMPS